MTLYLFYVNDRLQVEASIGQHPGTYITSYECDALEMTQTINLMQCVVDAALTQLDINRINLENNKLEEQSNNKTNKDLN